MNGAGEDSVKRSRAVASIPLCALADEAKAFQRNTRQIDGLRGDVETMDRGRMGDDHLDNVDVDPEGYRSGASLGPHLAVVDQFLPIEVADLLLPQIALERCERDDLAASGRFPYLAHIGYMEVDEVAKGLEAGDGRLVRCQPLIDPGLRLPGPAMGVVAAKERLARVAALSSDLDPVGTGRKLGDGGHFRVRCVCNESS